MVVGFGYVEGVVGDCYDLVVGDVFGGFVDEGIEGKIDWVRECCWVVFVEVEEVVFDVCVYVFG